KVTNILVNSKMRGTNGILGRIQLPKISSVVSYLVPNAYHKNNGIYTKITKCDKVTNILVKSNMRGTNGILGRIQLPKISRVVSHLVPNAYHKNKGIYTKITKCDKATNILVNSNMRGTNGILGKIQFPKLSRVVSHLVPNAYHKN